LCVPCARHALIRHGSQCHPARDSPHVREQRHLLMGIAGVWHSGGVPVVVCSAVYAAQLDPDAWMKPLSRVLLWLEAQCHTAMAVRRWACTVIGCRSAPTQVTGLPGLILTRKPVPPSSVVSNPFLMAASSVGRHRWFWHSGSVPVDVCSAANAPSSTRALGENLS